MPVLPGFDSDKALASSGRSRRTSAYAAGMSAGPRIIRNGFTET
jgi:hypothetical protein